MGPSEVRFGLHLDQAARRAPIPHPGCEGLLLPGQRPQRGRRQPWRSYLRLFGHLKSIINFNAEVAHGAFKLRMS